MDCSASTRSRSSSVSSAKIWASNDDQALLQLDLNIPACRHWLRQRNKDLHRMGLLRLSFGIKALGCWMLPSSDVVDKEH